MTAAETQATPDAPDTLSGNGLERGADAGPRRGRRRRWPLALLVIVLVLAVGMGVGWAGATVFRPPPPLPPAQDFTTAEVVSGEVGSSVQLNVTASWPRAGAGANRAAGVVTEVVDRGGVPAEPGDVLYTVGLRPVVVAEGTVPSFRDLGAGARGEDVVQLQRLLGELGWYRGPADGRLEANTVAAVQRWQRDLDLVPEGATPDGVVRAGDVLFVPALPARLVLDDEVVTVGATLAGGEPVVAQLAAAPDFVLDVTAEQAARMPTGTAVQIPAPDGSATWQAEVASSTSGADDTVRLVLAAAAATTADEPAGTAPTGAGDTGDDTGQDTGDDAGSGDGAGQDVAGAGVICGSSCGVIPVDGQTLLPSTVVTDPPVQGLTLPVAALSSGADGTVSVVDADGTRRPVDVLAAVGGVAVVEGLAEGDRVRLPAPDAAADGTTDEATDGAADGATAG